MGIWAYGIWSFDHLRKRKGTPTRRSREVGGLITYVFRATLYTYTYSNMMFFKNGIIRIHRLLLKAVFVCWKLLFLRIETQSEQQLLASKPICLVWKRLPWSRHFAILILLPMSYVKRESPAVASAAEGGVPERLWSLQIGKNRQRLQKRLERPVPCKQGAADI